MTTHPTYTDALAAIWDRSGYDRGFISNPFAGDEAAQLGLVRTEGTLALLGNPHLDIPIIHVAGSKGKGSTTAFIASIARAAGIRTSHFVSPHLHSYRERLVLNSTPITEEQFASLTFRVLEAASRFEAENPDLGTLTAWELSTAMALAWFAEMGAELAVVEVGMGGTLDATNVVTPAISVITTLDYEHTAVLGDTIEKIAQNKAGIIKPGRPVVSADQPDPAMAVLRDRASDMGSPLYAAGTDWIVAGEDRDFRIHSPLGDINGLRSSLLGQHQLQNAALAVAALRYLPASPTPITDDHVREGLATTVNIGRFEFVELPNGRNVILDGAHSPLAAHALRETITDHAPGQPYTVILGMLQDKSHDAVIDTLIDGADSWIVAATVSPRAVAPAMLRDALERRRQVVTQSASVAAALTEAQQHSPSLIVVTGSLSTVAEARVALGLAVNDPVPPRRQAPAQDAMHDSQNA